MLAGSGKGTDRCNRDRQLHGIVEDVKREVKRGGQRKRYAANHDMAAEQHGQRHPLIDVSETIDRPASYAWRWNGGHQRADIAIAPGTQLAAAGAGRVLEGPSKLLDFL